MKILTRVWAASTLLVGVVAQADTPSSVPLATALEAAQAAVAACKANGYNVTVTVMDMDLTTRLVLRADGAPERTVEIGRRKAYTVIKTGMSSGDFGKTVPPPPRPATPPAPGSAPPMPGPVNGDPNLITWAGGLPITAGGKTSGAIRASGAPGGDKDEACVSAGLAKIGGGAK